MFYERAVIVGWGECLCGVRVRKHPNEAVVGAYFVLISPWQVTKNMLVLVAPRLFGLFVQLEKRDIRVFPGGLNLRTNPLVETILGTVLILVEWSKDMDVLTHECKLPLCYTGYAALRTQ